MKHQEAAQRHLKLTKDGSYSSDDDEDDDTDDTDVFGTIVKSFNLSSGALLVIALSVSLMVVNTEHGFI